MAVEKASPSADALHACHILHPITVRSVSRQMPPEAVLDDLAGFFKLFSDRPASGQTRQRMVA